MTGTPGTCCAAASRLDPLLAVAGAGAFMSLYLFVKWTHVLSSVLLAGTGLGRERLAYPAPVAMLTIFRLMVARPALRA